MLANKEGKRERRELKEMRKKDKRKEIKRQKGKRERKGSKVWRGGEYEEKKEIVELEKKRRRQVEG